VTARAILTLTDGNFRNSHLYLSGIKWLFPKDAYGGKTKEFAAPRVLELDIGLGAPISTDIAGGNKQFFRLRAWVRPFLDAHGLKPGDRVVIERTGPDKYHVYPMRGMAPDLGED
jgi:hypothetical protein